MLSDLTRIRGTAIALSSAFLTRRSDVEMHKRILITGGAGFIGSHLADELLAHGYDVRILDSLCSQVHGAERQWPSYLSRDVELLIGEVQNAELATKALKNVDAVFHFAAM